MGDFLCTDTKRASDEKCLFDLVFLLDITDLLNALNIQPQGKFKDYHKAVGPRENLQGETSADIRQQVSKHPSYVVHHI